MDAMIRYIPPGAAMAERVSIFKMWREAGVRKEQVEFKPSDDNAWTESRAFRYHHQFGVGGVPCRFGEYRVVGPIPDPKSNPLDETLKEMEEEDAINPSHYTNHPSGVECRTIIRHMPTCIAMAVKYLWRLDEKYNGTKDIEDLRKAIRWLEEEIDKRETV